MTKRFKPGDVVIANENVFNLIKGQEYEVKTCTYFGGVILKDFENLDGGYSDCWFDLKPTDSENFAQNLLNGITADILAFEELERQEIERLTKK